MFARGSRISAEKDIQAIFQRGRRFSSPLFRAWVYKRSGGPFRALIIVSKKVSKRSTKRNLVKRRAREILRREIAKSLPMTDMILEISPAALSASYQDLRNIILEKFL